MAVLAGLTACDGNKFHVDGTVEGASDSLTMVLEQSSNGEWFIIDSVKIGKTAASASAPRLPRCPASSS